MRCVACGFTTLEKVFTAKDINEKSFTYLSCKNCDSLQISTYDDDLLEYAYHPSYYGGNDEKFKWPFSLLFSISKKLTAKKIARLYPNKNTKILDAGCGNGSLLRELSLLGYKNLSGNEFHPPARKHKNIKWIKGNFTDIPETESYNFISLYHVFEHLPDPKNVIKKLSRISVADAKILIAIPNIASTQANQYGKHWLHLDPPRHLHLTHPSSLVKMFEEEGFSCIDKNYNSLFYNPFGYLQSWLNKHHSKRDFLYYSLIQGNQLKSLNTKLIWLLHFVFAAISFPFYSILNFRESKAKKGGTVEMVFQKNG